VFLIVGVAVDRERSVGIFGRDFGLEKTLFPGTLGNVLMRNFFSIAA
jgi:hypothetical protein